MEAIVHQNEAHFSSAFAEMDTLRGERELCDVVLVAKGREIEAHRVVLAAHSPFFRAMFTTRLAERDRRVIELHDIDSAALDSLVHYSYRGFVRIGETNVQALLSAADALQYDSVKEACSGYLCRALHPSNCIGIQSFAELHHCCSLSAAASTFIHRNFSSVRRHDEYLQLAPERVATLLDSDRLHVTNEIEIVEAVFDWINHDKCHRAAYLSQLFSIARLHLIPLKNLLDTVGKNPLVTSNQQCTELLLAAVSQLTLSEARDECHHHTVLKKDKRKPPEKIYCAGGWDGQKAVSTVESFDTETCEWKKEESMLLPRNGVSLAILEDNLYAVGGHDGISFLNSAEVYNIKTCKWTPLPLCKYRRASTGLATHDGKLYVVGGQDGVSRLRSVECYDPCSARWERVAPMNTRRDCPGVVAHKGLIYVIGGCHPCMFLDTVEVYDPSKNLWASAMHMKHKRSAMGVVSVNDFIYAFGGHDERSNLDVLERYDPSTNTWTTLRHMNSPRAGVGASIIDGRIIALGGYDGTSQLDSVEEYDIERDVWSFLPRMNCERSYSGCTSMFKMI